MNHQVKLDFQLNKPCNSQGHIYNGSLLPIIDTFIKTNGFVFLYDEEGTLNLNNFIGDIVSYDIKNNYIIFNIEILNSRFNSLKNIQPYLHGLLRTIGNVDENNIIRISEIIRLEVII